MQGMCRRLVMQARTAIVQENGSESQAMGLVSRVIKTHLLHSLPLSLSHTLHTHTVSLSLSDFVLF